MMVLDQVTAIERESMEVMMGNIRIIEAFQTVFLSCLGKSHTTIDS